MERRQGVRKEGRTLERKAKLKARKNSGSEDGRNK